MTHMVYCVKLDKQAEGLDAPPYPGELGLRIYDNVSKDAWALWIKRQTMLINEYRLSVIEPQARTFLEKEMQAFFFGEGETVDLNAKIEADHSPGGGLD